MGEIVVKGPQIMLGYSNNDQANKETFDGAGWLRSGDTGYYDEDGFLYLVDRIKELIKVKGLQVRGQKIIIHIFFLHPLPVYR